MPTWRSTSFNPSIEACIVNALMSRFGNFIELNIREAKNNVLDLANTIEANSLIIFYNLIQSLQLNIINPFLQHLFLFIHCLAIPTPFFMGSIVKIQFYTFCLIVLHLSFVTQTPMGTRRRFSKRFEIAFKTTSEDFAVF